MKLFGRGKSELPDPRPVPRETTREPAKQAPTRGPFDLADAPEQPRVDLGGLHLPVVEDIEYRLEVNQQNNQVRSVTAVHGASSMQIHVYAAPRSGGEWRKVAAEIEENVTSSGGSAELSLDGPMGRQLTITQPNGQVMRLLGHDGSRWFLRAALIGPAAHEDQAAEPLLDVLRATAVVRGEGAMAPRDPLPLTMPVQPQSGEQAQSATPKVPQMPQRGPEITEIG